MGGVASGDSVSPSGSASASAGTAAIETTCAPGSAIGSPDAFVCLTTRHPRPVRIKGLIVRISVSPILNGNVVPSTEVGTLKVINNTTGVVMSDVWTLWDMPKKLIPGAGVILTLANSKALVAAIGDEIQVVYNSTGAVNDGAIGEFQILSLVALAASDAAL